MSLKKSYFGLYTSEVSEAKSIYQQRNNALRNWREKDNKKKSFKATLLVFSSIIVLVAVIGWIIFNYKVLLITLGSSAFIILVAYINVCINEKDARTEFEALNKRWEEIPEDIRSKVFF